MSRVHCGLAWAPQVLSRRVSTSSSVLQPRRSLSALLLAAASTRDMESRAGRSPVRATRREIYCGRVLPCGAPRLVRSGSELRGCAIVRTIGA